MILGITGKIASGKSEALRIFKKMGFYCIDADKVVHDLYKSGEAGAILIRKYFGEQYLLKNGDVDRKKLGNLVFMNKSKLLLLNKLMHPCVHEKIKAMMEKALINGKNIAIEAVYLDQDYLGSLVDKILLIERSSEKISAALIKDRGMSKEVAEKMKSVLNLPKKVDFVIQNDGSFKDLENELRKIL
ncbi:MAG: dephospho-CoA kinase [Candidatus Gracilibacteria bacterium]